MSEAKARLRRVTSADVAKEVGVSRTTVSFVLNDTPGQSIPAETRRLVIEAAERLSYRPSAEARTLRRGRSDVVLMPLPRELPMTEDVGRLIEHLAVGFAQAGLTLVAHPWTTGQVREAWATISPAAVLAWSLSSTDAERIRRDGVPVVTSLAGGDDPIASWVQGARETAIADLLVERLVAAGHRRLAYAAPADDRLSAAARLRHGALARACTARGLAAPVAAQVPARKEVASSVVNGWLENDPPATGVAAHDVRTAMAVLAGARLLGRSVPHDLAVVGVNDSEIASLAEPALTMVTVDAQATARYVVAVVRAMLDDAPLPAGPEGVVGLVERESA